jgi:glycolate oxidase
MALERALFHSLEEIVGADNISDDPVILDSYAFQWLGDIVSGERGDRFGIQPAAVVLPGTTEEVQAIVSVCNKYRVKFKAASTGWGLWAGPGMNGVVQIDLRRMNRILEINEKNMYAVVEPYVIGARLQVELMKRNLNCQIITAGSNVSALPLTALGGDGFSSVSTSMHSRNILGVEWVLPTGEILRLGSLGSGSGWFCGDGPGPSLRGILRGVDAAAGGMGVFTKAATKIYHWPGTSDLNQEESSAGCEKLTFNGKRFYYPVFPSWEKLAEAGIKIAESEISYGLGVLPKLLMAEEIADSNEASVRIFNNILESAKDRPGMLVVFLANSKKEVLYQEKTFRRILVETGGEHLPLFEKADVQKDLAWHFIRLVGPRRYFRCTGGGFTYWGTLTNWGRIPRICQGEANRIVEKYTGKGLILDCAGDLGFATSIEYGHMGVVAINVFYDHTDPEARKALAKMGKEIASMNLEQNKFTVSAIFAEEHDIFGPMYNNYHIWQRKIKNAFDPYTSADPSHYVRP